LVSPAAGTANLIGYTSNMDITAGNEIIARHLNSAELSVNGLTFYSEDNDAIQVGIWSYDGGKVLAPHIHNLIPKTSNRTCEVLYVISGSIHADVYDENAEIICGLEIKRGDILICLAGGHGYRILEPGTLVLEVKNGPYFGPEMDRRRIESQCNH
jgi:hypothetical protein